MKKLLLVLLISIISVLALAAYPQYHWGDADYTDASNKSIKLDNQTVNVDIYQWLSAKFLSRNLLATVRGASVSNELISDSILIDKPGEMSDVLLGGIAIYSNGNVDISVKADDNYAPTNKQNLNYTIQELKLSTFNNYIGKNGINFTKSIVDTVAEGNFGNTSDKDSAKITNLKGNANDGETGPEFIISADLNIPVNIEPGKDKYVFSLDIEVTPKTKF